MQEITREQLISRAAELLEDGTVDRVLGWRRGEFAYDVTPGLFRSAAELERDFVWGDFCGANFSKYLIEETRRSENRVLTFLKPCDTYSFNQLLTEHRFVRDRVYVLGVPCAGFDGDQADPRNFNAAQYETRVQGLVEAMAENKKKKEG